MRRLSLVFTPLLLLAGVAATAVVAVIAVVAMITLGGNEGTPLVATVPTIEATPTPDVPPRGVPTAEPDTFDVSVDDFWTMNLDADDLERVLPQELAPLLVVTREGAVEVSPIDSERERPASDGSTAGVFVAVDASDRDDPDQQLALASSRVVLYRSSTDALAEFFELISEGRQLVTEFGPIDAEGEPASGAWDDAVRITERAGSTIVLVRVGPVLGTVVVVRTDGESTAEAATTLARVLAERMRRVLTGLGAFED